MKKYTVGFLFDDEGKSVLLIRKTHPQWQAGKLNGIGGKLEQDETPLDCMNREGIEEAGLDGVTWKRFCVISSAHVYDPAHDKDGWRVHFFYAFSTKAFHLAGSTTDEEIVRVPVAELNAYLTIPNLRWLIPMALSMVYDRAELFEVIER